MPFDPVILLSMIFAIVVLLLIGGFIVSYPLFRRLGGLMDAWIASRERERLHEDDIQEVEGSLAEVRGRLSAIENRMELLVERQEFTESLLQSGESGPDRPTRDAGEEASGTA